MQLLRLKPNQTKRITKQQQRDLEVSLHCCCKRRKVSWVLRREVCNMHTYQGVMGGRHGGHSQKINKNKKMTGNRTGCKPTGHPHSACRGSCVASDPGTWLLWEVIMCFLEISTSCPTPESKQPFRLRLKLNRLMPLARNRFKDDEELSLLPWDTLHDVTNQGPAWLAWVESGSVGYWAADSGAIVSMHSLEEVGMIGATTQRRAMAVTGMPTEAGWVLQTETNMLVMAL